MAEKTRSLVESYVTEHPSLSKVIESAPDALTAYVEIVAQHPSLGTEFFDLISCSKPFQEGKGVSLTDMMRSYLKDNSVEDPEGFNWDQEMTSDIKSALLKNGIKYAQSAGSTWEYGDGSVTVAQLAEKIHSHSPNKSKVSIENMLRKGLSDGRIVGFKKNPGIKSSWYLPLWLYDKETGGIIEGVAKLCNMFDSNGLPVQQFVTKATLNDGSIPLDLLRKGKIKKVIALAKSYAGNFSDN